MPELDGLGATAEIRAEADFDALPIIAMTAHATVEERERCLAGGMQDHIAKPIDPAALYSTVRHHSRRSTEVAAPSRDAANAASSPPVAPSPTGDGLPVVAGLDTADGLLRLGGNRPLYLKLLRQFVEQQADAPAQVVGPAGGGGPRDGRTAGPLDQGGCRQPRRRAGPGGGSQGGARDRRLRAASGPRGSAEHARRTSDRSGWRSAAGARRRGGSHGDLRRSGAARPGGAGGGDRSAEDVSPRFRRRRAGLAGGRERTVPLAVGAGGVPGLRQRIEAYAFDDAAAWLDVEVGQTGSEYELGHPVPSTSTAAATDNPQAVQLAIDRLHQYLTDCDAAAVDHLETNRELVRAWFSREAFAELEQRIQAFAFDEARALLEEAMTSHARLSCLPHTR